MKNGTASHLNTEKGIKTLGTSVVQKWHKTTSKHIKVRKRAIP